MSNLQSTKEPTPTLFNQSLLFKLYKTSKKALINPISIQSKSLQRVRHYPELQLFKTQLEEEHRHRHPHLYAEAKQKLFYYRVIFIALAFTFLALSSALNQFSFNWSYSFIFESWFKAKWIIGSLSVLLAFASCACAYSLSSLHEATAYVTAKAKKTLRRIYNKQRIQCDVDVFFLWGENQRKSNALRHIYQEVLDKIHERGEDTYRLLKKIERTPSLASKEKEHLYNQALAELYDKLTFSMQSFKHLEFDETSARLFA